MKITKIKSGVTVFAAVLLVAGFVMSNMASATVPGVNDMVSINRYNSDGGNQDSSRPYISGDGKFVAFDSSANDLISSDSNNRNDVFIRNLGSSSTNRVSVSGAGTQADDSSTVDGLSRTGRYVLFHSNASNLIDGSSTATTNAQLYLRDTVSNTTTLLSQNSSGDTADNYVVGLDVSSDGRFILFYSGATNLGPSVTNTNSSNLYMLDRTNNSFTILNKTYNGSLPNNSGWTPYAHMSCDGSLVVLQSAPNLTTTSSSHVDVYLLDRRAGDHLTDLTAAANGAAIGPNISCNGEYIGFASYANNLDTSITDTSQNHYHAYSYNRVNNTFSVVDQASSGTSGNTAILPTTSGGGEQYMQLSDTGVAVFQTAATNLVSGGTSGQANIYVRNVVGATTELLSRDSSASEGNGSSQTPTVASDGKLASYKSNASNLVSSDTNSHGDVFTSQIGN